jgi:recombination protein RecT
MSIQPEQKTIGQYFNENKSVIAKAMPKHMDADRMLRIINTEVRKTPKLKECSAQSLFGAAIQSSLLGLEPGAVLGHAYLIPYGKECQFIIGYRGMIELARRSGHLITISAHCVYESDIFEIEYGINEKLRHVPLDGERGHIKSVYGVAQLKGGFHQIEMMFKSEVDSVRRRSKCANSGPWVTDYEEMAKKTVVRRMFKYLPSSIEIQKAIALDEAADRGEQYNGIIIDHDSNEQPETKADHLSKQLEQIEGAGFINNAERTGENIMA